MEAIPYRHRPAQPHRQGHPAGEAYRGPLCVDQGTRGEGGSWTHCVEGWSVMKRGEGGTEISNSLIWGKGALECNYIALSLILTL